MRALVRTESWPIRGGFRIARGARAEAEVVVVELDEGGRVGRGECVPYARYGESIDSVRSAIEAVCRGLKGPIARQSVLAMPAGAARNAMDCALWDLEAKQTSRPAWALVGFGGPPSDVATMRTVSVNTAEKMRAAAEPLADARVIKVKVDGGADLDRIAAVHDAAPGAKLVIDANEAWSTDQLAAWLPQLQKLGVAVLEQPLPAGEDSVLADLEHAISICADESFHDRGSFARIEGRYDMGNKNLDKAGGLSEALHCVEEAGRRGVRVMVGCMVSTSLAIEPALLLTGKAEYVDLDGPLLLEADREGSGHDRQTGVLRPSSSIWGAA
jgi:L-alanine-DL-glutamate epimerase-like enolase superfamily enzyme